MPEQTAETVPGVTRWRPRKVVEAIQIPGFVSDAVEAFTDGTHLEWELDDAALLLGVVMRLDPLLPVVGRLAIGDWIVRVPGTPRFAGYGAAEFAAKFEPAAGSPISATLGVIRSQVTAALEDWDGQGFGDPADAVMAAVTPGLESILGALQAGAAGISGPGAGDEPSGADTGPQEAAEPLPPGHFVSAGQITATLLEAFPVTPALAAALGEVLAQVLSANAEARRAWDQVGRQAGAKVAALEDAAVLRRNWHDDRDKLVALRRWAEKNLRGRTLDGILAVFQQEPAAGGLR